MRGEVAARRVRLLPLHNRKPRQLLQQQVLHRSQRRRVDQRHLLHVVRVNGSAVVGKAVEPLPKLGPMRSGDADAGLFHVFKPGVAPILFRGRATAPVALAATTTTTSVATVGAAAAAARVRAPIARGAAHGLALQRAAHPLLDGRYLCSLFEVLWEFCVERHFSEIDGRDASREKKAGVRM